MSDFRDHFSGHAAEYARSRPTYPAALFSWLASLVERHELAWDCATGNGQAAEGVARHWRRVVATDASLDQLAAAGSGRGIDFVAALSSDGCLPSARVDLVTVAQALHWFDLEPFYREVERALAPGGVLAAWTYALFRVTPEIDELIDRFANVTVGSFWPSQRRHIDVGYADLAFPFDEIEAPEVEMRIDWTLDEVVDYLETWSAVRRFWTASGVSPVARIEPELLDAWGPRASRRAVRWQLAFRVGRRMGGR